MLFTILTILVAVVGGSEELAQTIWAGIMVVAPFVLAIVAFASSAWSETKRTKAARATMAAATSIACPSCGASGALWPGQGVGACDRCGATLVPSEHVMTHQLDAARHAHRVARMERLRAERRGAAGLQKMSLAKATPVMIAVSLLTPAVLGSVAILGEDLYGRDRLAALVLASATFVGVAGFACWLWLRRAKARTWRSAMRDLAQHLRGQLVLTLDQRVDWLNRLWMAEIAPAELHQSTLGCAAAVDADGYPALVLADPRASCPAQPARVEVLLAAWLPGLSDGMTDASAMVPSPSGVGAWRWITSQGFEITPSEAGLRATANATAVATLHRNPAALHALVPIIRTLAMVARSVHAVPVTAVP